MAAKITRPRRFNVVCLTDWHVPFHDDRALQVAFSLCKHIQPSVIILHELHDFYRLSHFDQDPSRIEGRELQNELDQVSVYLKKLRKCCPKSRIYLLESNHLNRLKRYLWRNARALASLRAMEIESLLNLADHHIIFRKDVIIRNFLFKHGSIVRQHSSYTAKGEFLKEGMSGASGHTHRLGQYYATLRGGSYTWLECGCLCSLEPEWISGVPNWQHGLGLVSFKGNDDHFDARVIPIIDYEILWGNVNIKA